MKKAFLALLIGVFVLSSCMFLNTPPTVPSNPHPRDGETEVPLRVTLSWKSSDPDGDSVSFDLYFGTDPNPPLKISDLKDDEYTLSDLSPNTVYYWKVAARDERGAVAEGPVWRFKTLSESVEFVSRTVRTGRVYYLEATYRGSGDLEGKAIRFAVYDEESNTWEDLEDAITGEDTFFTDERGKVVISVFPTLNGKIRMKAYLADNPSIVGEGTLTVEKSNWAFLWFVVADNNLQNMAFADFTEARNTNENVAVISIFDTKDLGDYFVVQDELGEWKSISLSAHTGGDINTGDPEWLKAGLYLLYSISSNYRGLILWDHGSAWIYDSQYSAENIPRPEIIGQDETSGDALTIAEVRNAVEEVMSEMGVDKLDLLGMDACLMSSLEVGFELRNTARYFLASAFTEPGYGWDYEFLNHIDGSTDPLTLGRIIVDGFINQNYGESENLSLVLWDLSRFYDIAKAVSDIGNRLSEILDDDLKSRMLEYNSAITHYGDSDEIYHVLVDIGDLLYMIENYEQDSILIHYAEEAEDAISEAYEYGQVIGNVYSTTKGLSIYFPTTAETWNFLIYDINTLEFYTNSRVNGWGNFLYEFLQM